MSSLDATLLRPCDAPGNLHPTAIRYRGSYEQPHGQACAPAQGHGRARGLHDRGRAGAGAGRRRVPRQDRVHLARSRHARLGERRQVLRAAGRHRRGHARLCGRHRRGIQPSRLQDRRCRAGPVRRAAICHLRRPARRQGRHLAGAAAALDRRARHAGLDGLLRPARGGPAQGRRDGRGVGGVRRGRLDRRADRQDQGLPRGRHRRRARQVPLRHAGARASTPASTTRPAISRPTSRPRRPRASTSTSRTSAARSSTPCCCR